MFESIRKIFKKDNTKKIETTTSKSKSKEAAKERLHLVLMQDRANVSVDFLELMKQEIIDVIKKYIEVDDKEIDVRLTNKENGDGTNGAPALYANIPILNIKNDARKVNKKEEKTDKQETQNTNIEESLEQKNQNIEKVQEQKNKKEHSNVDKKLEEDNNKIEKKEEKEKEEKKEEKIKEEVKSE